jgi:cellulose synthase/poly-beta-1,6-N-acetylglucosamine synthase-like glycosyltransferase
MLAVITAIVIALAVSSLVRMAVYLVGADLNAIRKARSKGRVLPAYRPPVSIVVPMHNEGAIVERTLEHLMKVDYEPLQIIIVDDGSTDDTAERIGMWKIKHDHERHIEAFTKTNGGKADALNTAIRTRATGELIMCLDGDSILAPDAVEKSVAHFTDQHVVATASNVNILRDGTLLGFIQRFEYLVNHHMKKAQTAFNIEYIIGGVGSMFRRETLDEVGYYDTNTMTEDIDLTMKIIARKGNKKNRVMFAADSIVYTEAVPSFRSLIKQRTRWKYGRAQAFYKNWRLFFSRDRKHSLALSWFALPVVVFQEAAMILEPLSVAFIFVIGVMYKSPATILSAVVLMSVFSILNIMGNTHVRLRDRFLISLAAPLMYAGFYAITVVEYVALLYLVTKAHRLRASVSQDQVTWVSPERSGAVLEKAA